MSVIQLEPIKLEKKKTGIAAYREKKGLLPGIVKVMTSPVTTAVLGTALAALLFPAAAGKVAIGLGKAAKFVAPKTVKGALGMAIGVPVAVGLLKESPKARELVRKTLDPREGIKRGEEIAKMIEDPEQLTKKLKEEGLWETIKEGAKKGGKYGAIAAGVLGVAAITKKGVPFIKEKLEERKVRKELEAAKEPLQLDPGIRAMGFTEPQPVGIGGIPISAPPGLPVGAPTATKTQPAVSNIIQIQVQ
ncbi:hypothetical protein ES703_70257 [subsurface metagenome]